MGKNLWVSLIVALLLVLSYVIYEVNQDDEPKPNRELNQEIEVQFDSIQQFTLYIEIPHSAVIDIDLYNEFPILHRSPSNAQITLAIEVINQTNFLTIMGNASQFSIDRKYQWAEEQSSGISILPPIDGRIRMEIDIDQNITFSYFHYLSSGDIFGPLSGCQYAQQIDQEIIANEWYSFSNEEIQQMQICA
ncbi:MAG: hypothetical protein ACXAB7_13090 [Candidatus Kariarchaeaceae archaeon]|jgi:hypothetical protein